MKSRIHPREHLFSASSRRRAEAPLTTTKMALRLIALALAATTALAAGRGGGGGAPVYEARDAGLSERLTVSSFDSVVQAEIDAGRTMFVRWIPSEG